jgi:hypothetical protein
MGPLCTLQVFCEHEEVQLMLKCQKILKKMNIITLDLFVFEFQTALLCFFIAFTFYLIVQV